MKRSRFDEVQVARAAGRAPATAVQVAAYAAGRLVATVAHRAASLAGRGVR